MLKYTNKYSETWLLFVSKTYSALPTLIGLLLGKRFSKCLMLFTAAAMSATTHSVLMLLMTEDFFLNSVTVFARACLIVVCQDLFEY